MNESKAKMIGANISADYILFGTVTIFGQSISLDVSMVDITKQAKALTFSKQAKEPGAVITQLDLIATEINYTVFSRTKEDLVPKAAVTQQSMQDAVNDFSNPMARYQALLSTNGIINGIAVGNVDGEQGDEVVIIRDHKIEIFKPLSNGQLKSVKIINDVNYMRLISIDTVDLNKNGKDEIFITRIDNRASRVSSIVYEFNGNDFEKIGKPLPWYLRAVNEPNGNRILYGQSKGDNGPYSSRYVFKVEWSIRKYMYGKKIQVPRGFSVLSMVKGIVEGKGQEGFLFTDRRGKLTWFNSAGKIEWEGDEGFGGSKLYFKLAKKDPSYGSKVFFHPRNILADLNQDGVNELIAIKNIEASDHLIAQLKNYRKGQLEVFSWQDFGLSQKMLPKKTPGQITDIAILKGSGDIPDKLLVTIIKKRNTFAKEKSKSVVVGYDIVEKSH